MPRMAIRMASAAQWAALGPYLQTMLPRYAVQLTQLSGPLCGVLVGPIVGAYSDRNTSCFGRRRPYLVTAAVGSIIYWVLMSYTRELGDAFGDVCLENLENSRTARGQLCSLYSSTSGRDL